MVTRSELMQVQSQNWRDHGARGEVDPSVMEDIGFIPFEQMGEVFDQAEATRREALRESVIQGAGSAALNSAELSSTEKNANESRFIAGHRRRTAHQKQIHPDQRM